MAERSVSELEKILYNDEAPMEERIKAAAELYEWYLKGAEVPLAIVPFAKMDIDELKEIIDEKQYVEGSAEEAIVKGVFNARVERMRKRLKKLGLTEAARLYVTTKSEVEKEIAREFLRGKEETLEREARVLTAAAELMKAEAISKEAEFIAGNIPKVESPTKLRFLSDLQVKAVNTPSRYYAKEAFSNGLWNERWGDPEDYGIDVHSAVSYVRKPANKDFAELMYRRGIWLADWGNPEDYGVY